MEIDTLIDVQSARTITLSKVISNLCNSKLVRSISLEVFKINK